MRKWLHVWLVVAILFLAACTNEQDAPATPAQVAQNAGSAPSSAGGSGQDTQQPPAASAQGESTQSTQTDAASQQAAIPEKLQKPLLLQRQVEASELPYAAQHNIGFIPYSPLAQGLLTGKFNKHSTLPEQDVRSQLNPLFAADRFEQNVARAEALDEIARAYGKPRAQVAINWLLSKPAVTSVIAGAKTVGQVEENAAAAQWTLSEEDIERLDHLFRPLPQ